MKRRDFVKTSVGLASLAGLGAGVKMAVAADNTDNNNTKQQYYELRAYTLKNDDNRKVIDTYLRAALIPALNRLGINPVGVFTENGNPEPPLLYVLIPYNSLEEFITTPRRLMTDADYQKAGADYINIPKNTPAYVRLESALLLAFEGMPRLELPPYSAEKKPRLFELRTYESHSEKAGVTKIEMFNKGEIAVMKRVGLSPVFYGQTIIGPKMPNLTYMLSAENQDAHKKHWGAFGADPEWKKLNAIPEYAAAVSNISNKFLIPTDYSQI